MTTPKITSGRHATARRLNVYLDRINTSTISSIDCHDFHSLPLSQQLRVERERGLNCDVQDDTNPRYHLRDPNIDQSVVKKHQDTCIFAPGKSESVFRRRRFGRLVSTQDDKSSPLTLPEGCLRKGRLQRSMRQHELPGPRWYQTSTNAPTRPSPAIAPRPGAPSKPSSPIVKSKALPNRSSIPSRVPQRAEKKEEMLVSVRETDRQKRAQIVGWNATELARRKIWKELETRVDTFVSNSELRWQDLWEARLMKPFYTFFYRLDYLQAQTKGWIRDLNMVYGNILNRYHAVLQKTTERSLRLFIKVVIKPVEKSLFNVELELSQIQLEIAKVHKELHRAVLMTPSIVRIGAEAKIRVNTQEKSLLNQKQELWDNLQALSATIVEIGRKLRELRTLKEIPYLFRLRRIDKAYRVGVQLAMPFGNSWGTTISDIAHTVREIEMYRADANVLPELMIAKRWAVIMSYRYISPLRTTSDSLKNIFDEYPREWSSIQTQRWRNKFANVRSSLSSFLVQNDRLISLYSKVTCGGLTSFYSHPMKEFHLQMISAFRPFETYYQEWDELLNYMKDAQTTISVSQKSNPTSSSDDLRTATIRLLDTIQYPPQDLTHPLSRRGNRTDRFNAFVWHAARLLTNDLQSDMQEISTEAQSNDVVLVDTMSESLQVPDVMLSTRWLENKTLYPAGASIMIDYVMRMSTFMQIIQELREHKVISFDIVTSKRTKAHKNEIDYLLLASPTNIYIIRPFPHLSIEDPRFFSKCLDTILGDSSILKVCMSSHGLDYLLSMNFNTDLRGVFNLQQKDSAIHGSTFNATTQLLERTFGLEDDFSMDVQTRLQFVRDIDPLQFYRYLAMRVYAPLKLFYALNEQKSIQMTDSRALFHLGDYYDKVSKCDFGELELGPINIDRAHEEHRKVVLMRGAQAMARNFLQARVKRKSSKRNSRLVMDATHTKETEQNLTAYYMFTKFGERLRTISEYVDGQNASEYILQAADAYNLQLNAEDRIKLENVIKGEVYLQNTETNSKSAMPTGQAEDHDAAEYNAPKHRQSRNEGKMQEQPTVVHNSILAKLSEQLKIVYGQNETTSESLDIKGGEVRGKSLKQRVDRAQPDAQPATPPDQHLPAEAKKQRAGIREPTARAESSTSSLRATRLRSGVKIRGKKPRPSLNNSEHRTTSVNSKPSLQSSSAARSTAPSPSESDGISQSHLQRIVSRAGGGRKKTKSPIVVRKIRTTDRATKS